MKGRDHGAWPNSSPSALTSFVVLFHRDAGVNTNLPCGDRGDMGQPTFRVVVVGDMGPGVGRQGC